MNCHKYSGLRQHRFILWSAGQKSEMGLQNCVPSGGSGENLFIVFSSFWRPPAPLGLWPHHSDLCFHHHITLSDSDHTAYPFDYTGGLLLIQENLPVLRVLNLTSPEKSLCHSQVPEMRTWTSLWGAYSSYYKFKNFLCFLMSIFKYDFSLTFQALKGISDTFQIFIVTIKYQTNFILIIDWAFKSQNSLW